MIRKKNEGTSTKGFRKVVQDLARNKQPVVEKTIVREALPPSSSREKNDDKVERIIQLLPERIVSNAIVTKDAMSEKSFHKFKKIPHHRMLSHLVLMSSRVGTLLFP